MNIISQSFYTIEIREKFAEFQLNAYNCIVQYKENYKFDIASDASSVLYSKNLEYKVKEVNDGKEE